MKNEIKRIIISIGMMLSGIIFILGVNNVDTNAALEKGDRQQELVTEKTMKAEKTVETANTIKMASTGKVVKRKGWYTAKSGRKYYYKSDGTPVKNRSYRINGNLYLFSKSGILCTNPGFKTLNGKKYYLKKNGTLAVGYLKIGDDYYYFSKTGVMYRDRWAYARGYKFYFGKDGKRLTDVDEVLGKRSSYYITVNKNTNIVTVYAQDGNKGYTIPVKSFVCSTGDSTPLGTFYTPYRYRWLTLVGPCWGQWCTQIYGNYLFHSVCYNSWNDNNSLDVAEYNKLGTTCSHGCIRLKAGDAKWIYDNCALNTKVTIFSSNEKGPFPKPTVEQLTEGHTWDPTDPDMKYKCKQSGCNHYGKLVPCDMQHLY
ncbi:MAG: L,D-transpeptidase family protein [Lachnospiraceae bacterium]|nr:L,D-transpeptidase family protein [Lachnospiraceae bacterium]